MCNRENIDIFLLQETFLPVGTTTTLPGYNAFHLSREEGQRGGLTILARRWLDCQEEEHPLFCGERVDVQAIRVRLPERQIYLYNIYRPAAAELVIDEVFGLAAAEMVLIAGDFNAHHPWLNSTSPTNDAGHSLHAAYEDSGQARLLNDTGCPTHIQGGRLDLAFSSNLLNPTPTWSLHPHLTSDHFATIIEVESYLSPLPIRLKKINMRRADYMIGFSLPPLTPSWQTRISNSHWKTRHTFSTP